MAITTNGVGGISADGVATLSNKTLEAPVINNATFTGAQAGLEVKFGNNIVFEGTTADDYETTLSAGEPTADRTVTLPNATGTVALVQDKLSVFAATTSSELAGVISDETGSGALVFASAPTITNPIVSGLSLSDSSVIFEGSSADEYETTLTVTNPTADRTITLPNNTGTVILDANYTAKGKILVGTGTGTFTDLTVGANGQALVADSAQASGVKWSDAGVAANDSAFAFAVQVFA